MHRRIVGAKFLLRVITFLELRVSIVTNATAGQTDNDISEISDRVNSVTIPAAESAKSVFTSNRLTVAQKTDFRY